MATSRTDNGDPPIAVLPLGAHEYHGPHLPLETDSIIAEQIAMRLRDAPGDGRTIDLLPVEPVGYSPEHADRPGTLTLAYDEAIERWLGIAATLAERGARKLVLFNAHGGNSPLLAIVATEARIRFGLLCVATSWTRFGVPEDLVPAARRALDIHGGEVETSVMLHLRPDLVRLDAVRDFPSAQADFARDFRHLRAYGPHAFGWTMRDLNPEGAAGDARLASAEKGRRLVDHAVAGLGELLGDVARFDMARFR